MKDIRAIFDREQLELAWERVKSRSEAPGFDGVTPDSFGADLEANLTALVADVSGGAYQSQACLSVEVPKDDGGFRRIVIPTVRDRILQVTAARFMYPIINPLLERCCYAYRGGMGVQDALEQVARWRKEGCTHVLRADIADFFGTVQNDRVIVGLRKLGFWEDFLDLIKVWLESPLVDAGGCPVPRMPGLGLPQGLPVSPLLANYYLTPFDRDMAAAQGDLVRYADDFTVRLKEGSEGDRVTQLAAKLLGELGLGLSKTKVTVCSFEEGFLFLGAKFHGDELIPALPHPYEEFFSPPETRHHAPAKRPPSQAVPRMLQRTLYVQDQDAALACRSGRLAVLHEGKTLVELSLGQVDQVYLFGRAHVTTPAMVQCLRRNIPIFLLSNRGEYHGVLQTPPDGFRSCRRAQYRFADDDSKCRAFSCALVAAKIGNSRALLARHARNHPAADLQAAIRQLAALRERAAAAESVEQARGIEGAAAAEYFAGYAQCFHAALGFKHRNRRPPLDPVNSLLSFGYTLLHHNLYAFLHLRGLDPEEGFFHAEYQGHPALASDMMEEFRAPVVDALVLALANRNEFTPDDFRFEPGEPRACLLGDEARPRFLRAFEEHMAGVREHRDAPCPVDWRRIFDLQVARLRRHVEGTVSHYEPYLME